METTEPAKCFLITIDYIVCLNNVSKSATERYYLASENKIDARDRALRLFLDKYPTALMCDIKIISNY